MPGLPLALFAYAALAVIPTMSGSAQDASDVEVVTGRADAADRMTVPVQIGSNGPYHFLLDTGSQKTVLSIDLAARLALAPIEKKRIVGVAGVGTADRGPLTPVKVWPSRMRCGSVAAR